MVPRRRVANAAGSNGIVPAGGGTGDPSRITTAAAAQRMEEDLFVAELPHWLYRGDTPLHRAALRNALAAGEL